MVIFCNKKDDIDKYFNDFLKKKIILIIFKKTLIKIYTDQFRIFNLKNYIIIIRTQMMKLILIWMEKVDFLIIFISKDGRNLCKITILGETVIYQDTTT